MLALDIDDTLSNTAQEAMRVMCAKLNQSDVCDALLQKYSQPGDVPQWQTTKIATEIQLLLNSPDFLLSVSPTQQASHVVNELALTYGISCYITSRENHLRSVTRQWLKRHTFPQAKLIMRESSATESNWKLGYLSQFLPQVRYLIDDTLPFPIPKPFSGRVIWFNHTDTYQPLPPEVIALSSWDDVREFFKDSL